MSLLLTSFTWSKMSTLFRESSGTPFYFRSSTFCNVPSHFRMGCIPGILPGANPFAQSKGSFDPGKGPLFNASAFESTSSFNFYAGSGDVVTTLREFNYHDQSLALIKNTKITEKLNFQIRAEFFNLWNWHIFNSTGDNRGANVAFTYDVSSPKFGIWNGTVSSPRKSRWERGSNSNRQRRASLTEATAFHDEGLDHRSRQPGALRLLRAEKPKRSAPENGAGSITLARTHLMRLDRF
jgi:hypothetical protein